MGSDSETRVASVAAFDAEGRLLFGRRLDSGKWTLPGGHVEAGESPLKGAVRELLEEAGLKPEEMERLGDGKVISREGEHIRVYCFKATVSGTPSGKNDPDEECSEWRFVPVGNGLPDEIADNLHNQNNVTLRFLELQDGRIMKSEQDWQRLVKADDVQDPEDEVDRFLQHPDASERLMALKHPGVKPRHLLRAALDPNDKVAETVAHHQALDEPTLDKILQYRGTRGEKVNPWLLQTLAHNPPRDLSAKQLQDLFNHRAGEWGYNDLAEMLNAPNAGPELFDRMYNLHGHSIVTKEAVLENPKCPASLVNKAASDYLADAKEKIPSSRDLALLAVKHPNVDPNIVGALVDSQDVHNDTKALIIGEAHKLPEGAIPKILAHPDPYGSYTHLKAAALRRPEATHGDLMDALKSKDRDLRSAAAKSPNLKDDHFKQVFSTATPNSDEFESALGNEALTSERVLQSVFGNNAEATHVSKAMLLRPDLIDHRHIEAGMGHHEGVQEAMVESKHPAITADDLERMSQGGSAHQALVRAAVAEHPNTSLKTAQRLLHNDPNVAPRMNAAQHPLLTSEDLHQALRDEHDSHVNWQLLRHPGIKGEHIHTALRNPYANGINDTLQHHSAVDASHLDVAAKHPLSVIRQIAVGHKNATDQHVLQGAHDSDPNVRATAVNTGRLPINVIQEMAQLDPDARVQDVAHQQIAKEDPDSVFQEKVGPRLGVAKHRKARDLIIAAKKSGPTTGGQSGAQLSPKDLPPGDWSPGRLPNGNIGADKLQQHIDSQEPLNFNTSHGEWKGAQRHSQDKSKVFQLNITNDHIRKMKEAGVYNTFRNMQAASEYSAHPVAKHHGIGWVRYTGNARDGLFVDEVQSDFGQSFVRQAASQAAAEGQDPGKAAAEAEQKYPDQHFKLISKILFNGKHPNEVLHEAFQQHLRDKGHHNAKVSVHTVESKAPISLGKDLSRNCKHCGKPEGEHGLKNEHGTVHQFRQYTPNDPSCAFVGCGKSKAEHEAASNHAYEPGEANRLEAPGHFNVTYHDVPKKLGMEPSTYGALKTQKNPGMKGQPTWAGKVRKAERPFKVDLEVWMATYVPLQKMAHPTPTFPKMGLGDDRRETPYVSTPAELKSKVMLGAASNAHHPRNKDMALSNGKVPVEPFKAYGEKKFDRIQNSGSRGEATSGATGVQSSYARAGEVAPGGWQSSDNKEHGTKLHEDLHLHFNRVEKKYGPHGRTQLAQNLYEAIPVQYRQAMDEYQNQMGGPGYQSSPIEHEEKLARLLNYMNSRDDRLNFHDAATQLENPDYHRSDFDTKMKRAYHALRAASETADDSWATHVKTHLFAKGEEPLPDLNLPDDSDLGVDSEIVRDMQGFAPHLHSVFDAARFLVNGPELGLDSIRRALYREDSDLEAAALRAYGIEVTDQNLQALRAVQQVQGLTKAETTPKLEQVLPGVSQAQETASQVQRAATAGQVQSVDLKGKHSKGTLLVKDPGTKQVFLLKPGSGGPGPAAGAQEEHASQSCREAAFWHVAKQWHIDSAVPEAELLSIDGKQYAAIELLPFDWKNVEKVRQKDPGKVLKALERYREPGTLHQWAVLDFVLGNPDRHGMNLMMSPEGELKLIDHGSAFAGIDFDPSRDENSFVPFYLRAWAPARFNALSAGEKLKLMPTVSHNVEKLLRRWVAALDAQALGSLLQEYGIDPEPSLARLERVRNSEGPIDQAMNRLWVTT